MENDKPVQKKQVPAWAVFILVIAIWPIGLYLMWKQRNFNKPVRIILTVLVLLITFLKISALLSQS